MSFNFEPEHRDFRRHATTGILSAAGMQAVKILCQLGSVIILARLLTPGDFGLVAMVSPLIGFAALFQDLGLVQATIQKAKLTHDEINAFFWLNVVTAFFLSLLIAALSPFVGRYYHDDRVVNLTIAMGAVIFLGSLGNQHGAILQRRMHFGTSARVDILASTSSLIVSIAWALIFGGYWSIYAGLIASNAIPVIMLWVKVPWRPTFPRRVPHFRSMLNFGAGITVNNVMGFLGSNMDNVLIGHRWGDHTLGIYDRAYKLLLFPLQRFVWPLKNIMVPILSQLTNEPHRYRCAYLRVVEQIALATWPGILWAFVYSDVLVPTLLGIAWAEASPVFKYLALAGLLQTVTNSGTWLYISQGRAGDLAKLAVASTSISIASFVIGLPFGAVGVAAVYAASMYLRLPFVVWWVSRKGPVRATDFAHSLVPQAAGAAVAATTLYLAHKATSGSSPWLSLLVGLVAAYAAHILIAALFTTGRQTLFQTIAFARKAVTQILNERRQRMFFHSRNSL